MLAARGHRPAVDFFGVKTYGWCRVPHATSAARPTGIVWVGRPPPNRGVPAHPLDHSGPPFVNRAVSFSTVPDPRPPRGRDCAAWDVAPLPPTLDRGAAEAFCRLVAERHYENFSVVSRLVPPRLRQDFANVYAFCRWSDDLADEAANPAVGLAALGRWRAGLDECLDGRPGHPVYVALAATIRRHALDGRPFHDLLDAFAEDLAFDRDAVVVRYADREALLGYCRRSADPVGRIVLGLEGCTDATAVRQADAICTGLQLVNFWQDLRRDRLAGRVYVPESELCRHRVSPDELAGSRAGPGLRSLVAAGLDWVAECFATGAPLERTAPVALRPAISLFRAGGRAIAAAIDRAGCDTLAARPTVPAPTKARLVLRAMVAVAVGRCRESLLGPLGPAGEG